MTWPMGDPVPSDRRKAKARAVNAKATRPWHVETRWWLVAAILIVIAITAILIVIGG
jgi:hypothetical protein